MFGAIFLFWLLSFSADARDITFSPVSGIGKFQKPLTNDDGVDIATGSDFSGLMTFANLPYANCFTASDMEAYDIAILGAPFDTAVTARPGARFGPTGIRQGSRRMSASFGWSMYTGDNSYTSWAEILDCGDAPLTFLDNTVALMQLDKAHKANDFKPCLHAIVVWPKVVSGRKAKAKEKSLIPRIVTLGGDHTSNKPVGTFLHIAHEEGLIQNSSIHAGIRAPLLRRKGDIRNDLRCGFDIIKARDIDRIGVDGVIEKLKKRVGNTKVYISVDIDVLDPAFAPATGTAEVGGWTTRELLSILDGLEGTNVVGADVVEVAPIYDNPGETTVLAAAEIVHSLLTL
ncbi:MAG: hypothetical protein Q9161_008443 [Pseudevernia consocians]